MRWHANPLRFSVSFCRLFNLSSRGLSMAMSVKSCCGALFWHLISARIAGDLLCRRCVGPVVSQEALRRRNGRLLQSVRSVSNPVAVVLAMLGWSAVCMKHSLQELLFAVQHFYNHFGDYHSHIKKKKGLVASSRLRLRMSLSRLLPGAPARDP